MKLKITQRNQITLQDWNKLVEETYKRPYNFQQQDGCQERGVYIINISDEFDASKSDFPRDSIPEIINGKERGVSFKAWVEKDPNEGFEDISKSSQYLFWRRNFYPNIDVLAHDLYKKGLIPAGEYDIKVDW